MVINDWKEIYNHQRPTQQPGLENSRRLHRYSDRRSPRTTDPNSQSGGWIDKRGPSPRLTAVLAQRLMELVGQRARQCGRPRVSQ